MSAVLRLTDLRPTPDDISGDVLAGTISAALAAGLEPLEAAAAGVWMHGQAAQRLGAAFIADDLVNALTAVRAAL